MPKLSKEFMQEHGLKEHCGRIVGKNPVTGKMGHVDLRTARQLERIECEEQKLAEKLADAYLDAGVMSRQLMAFKRKKHGRGWHEHPEKHAEAARRGWEERRQRLGR